MSPTLVHHLLDDIVAHDAIAVTDSAGSWTYGELQHWSRAAGSWLADRGVLRGDRVLVRAASDKRLCALLFGCSRIGAIFVPTSPTLKQYQEAQIVGDADPRVVIGAGASTTWSSFDAVWADMSQREHASVPAPRHDVVASDPLIVFYTSGTTAEPKGIVATHKQIVFATEGIHERLQYRHDDVVYCRLPLNFDYGLYQALLATRACARLLLADERVVDPTHEIEQHEVTVVPVVPALATMIARFALRRQPTRRVRLLTNTGDALSLATIELLKQSFPAVAVQLMYGLTECKRVSILEPDGYLERPGCVGLPLRGTSVQVVDERRNPVAPHVVGEIVVAGPHVTDGYWRDAELTARTFGIDPDTGERTLTTGDFGYVDEDGYVYLEGRRDHIFKRRGVRMSVAEVEGAALDVPGVEEAALALAREGEDLVLCVVGDVRPTDVLRGLDDRLGAAKLPDRVVVVDELPRGSTGKLDRKALLLRKGADVAPAQA